MQVHVLHWALHEEVPSSSHSSCIVMEAQWIWVSAHHQGHTYFEKDTYSRSWQPMAHVPDPTHRVIGSSVWTWGFGSIWWQGASTVAAFPCCHGGKCLMRLGHSASNPNWVSPAQSLKRLPTADLQQWGDSLVAICFTQAGLSTLSSILQNNHTLVLFLHAHFTYGETEVGKGNKISSRAFSRPGTESRYPESHSSAPSTRWHSLPSHCRMNWDLTACSQANPWVYISIRAQKAQSSVWAGEEEKKLFDANSPGNEWMGPALVYCPRAHLIAIIFLANHDGLENKFLELFFLYNFIYKNSRTLIYLIEPWRRWCILPSILAVTMGIRNLIYLRQLPSAVPFIRGLLKWQAQKVCLCT